jgi:hypothetical protein
MLLYKSSCYQVEALASVPSPNTLSPRIVWNGKSGKQQINKLRYKKHACLGCMVWNGIQRPWIPHCGFKSVHLLSYSLCSELLYILGLVKVKLYCFNKKITKNINIYNMKFNIFSYYVFPMSTDISSYILSFFAGILILVKVCKVRMALSKHKMLSENWRTIHEPTYVLPHGSTEWRQENWDQPYSLSSLLPI